MARSTNGGRRHSRLTFFLARYFLLSLFPSSILPANGTCWYPEPANAKDSAKCYDSYDPNADNMCCKRGDACLVNRMCAHKTGDQGDWSYYRGGCTDPKWVSERCPVQFCYQDKDIEFPQDSAETMALCPDKQGYWYCNASRNLDSCQDEPAVYPIRDKFDIYDYAGSGGFSSSTTSSSTIRSTSTQTQKSSSSTTIPSTTTGTTASGSSSPALSNQVQSESSATNAAGSPGDIVTVTTNSPVATTDLSTVTTSTGATNAPPPGESHDDGRMIPIGIGAGFGSAIVVAGGVLAFFLIRKRRRESPARAETPPVYYEPEIGCRARGQPLSTGFWRRNAD